MIVSPPLAIAALGTCFAVCAAAYQTVPTQETVPPSTYVVFFEGTSGELTPQGRVVIERIASAVTDHAPEPVRVSGFTDRIDGSELNLDLAGRRAEAVIEILSAKGIPTEHVQPRPNSRPALPSLLLAPEHEHRVEIAFTGS